MVDQSRNQQDANVGNLGDILKHTALLQLAALVAKRNPDRTINYLETNAYKLLAPCPNSAAWVREVAEERRRSALISDYIAAESSWIIKGKYRCSVGLAIDSLPRRALFLAEKDPATRAELFEQLQLEGEKDAQLFADALELTKLGSKTNPGPLLGLVDPFLSPLEIWPAVTHAARALWEPGQDGIIAVFSYGKDSPAAWPPAPGGFGGPIASLDRKPYFLAIYATAKVAGEASTVARSLGWTVS